jgi:hypothetical protein
MNGEDIIKVQKYDGTAGFASWGNGRFAHLIARFTLGAGPNERLTLAQMQKCREAHRF